MLLRPLESFLRNITDKYLFQKQYDSKQLLKLFANEVLSVLDINRLVNLTVNRLVDFMKLENAYIMLLDENREMFRVVAFSGMSPSKWHLDAQKEFFAYLQVTGKYLLLDDPARKNILNPSIVSVMADERSVLAIPLFHRNEMVGVLFLGKKKSDEIFNQEDIDILLPLSRTLSIAITNAQLFEKLSQAQAQAAQREKMAVIGTLSAGINHEICNPLGIARGQCEMFLLNMQDGLYATKSTGELLEQAKVIMEKVIKETDRATVITKKLSSFAKPAKGEITNDVNAEKEIDEVMTLVEHDLKLDNIVITKRVEGDIPAISADRKQLQEILFNIVRNAAQAMGQRGTIEISVYARFGEVYIDITDTGEGISKQDQARIFDPFFTTKEPGKGTGLGLFIVKQIVERNNGRIFVKSESGSGTTFTLVFKAFDSSDVNEHDNIGVRENNA
ncbi:MAG: ATP-binding protein [Candidatus Omnitrophica bacterium]|nr:ATP-binding protein [Candidatus Omnitrophota bacterium]